MPDHDPQSPPTHATPPPAGRFVFAVFGLVFLGIGVSVIVFLWSQPFGAFGSPPLFFRIVGSLIAIAFVAMGGGTAYSAITAKPIPPGRTPGTSPTGGPSAAGYQCPSCGAPLDSTADVSPHGDVKCAHCDRWFNVHGLSAG